MPTERGSTAECGEVTAFDDLVGVLADTERRHIVRVLREHERLSIAELSRVIAHQSDDVDESAARVRLKHSHLPKLRNVGLVSVDDDDVCLEELTPTAGAILDGDPATDTAASPEPASTPPEEDDETPDADSSSPIRKLREQKRMFSTLVSNLPGIAYRCQNEPEWPMTFVSEGCRDLTGYDPGALEAGEVNWGEDIVHPDDRGKVWDEVQESLDAREQFEVTYRIQRSDGEKRWVWERGQGIFEQGELEAVEGFITDITERKERERRLEAVFDGTFQFMGLLEPDGTVLEANAAALEFGGLEHEDVVGTLAWETPWWQTDDGARQTLQRAVDRAADGEFVRYEETVQGADRTATIDFSLRPVRSEAGEVELLVAEGRDITERVRREDQLETLNEVSHELVEAESSAAVCDVAVEAARETLKLELASIELYDEETGQLHPAARTDAVVDLVGSAPLFAPDEGESWEVFVEQDGTVYRDVAAQSGIPDTGTPLDSAIVLPLGSHGVLIAGATEAEAFGETEVDLARVLASHVEASLDSLERERQLRERSEALAEKNERLTRVNALNDVIRELLQSLVGASGREEILRNACESLVSVGRYRFAWISSRQPGSDDLQPDTKSGIEDGYLDAVTVSTDADAETDPAGRALDTGEKIVVNNVGSDPPFAPWQKAALDRSYRSAFAIPLTYDDARYGVLTVYSGDPNQFDELEQSVLTELAEAISYAITAAERKHALTSDQTLELEFDLYNPDTPLFRCLQAVDGEFDFDGAVQSDEGGLSVFFTLSGTDVEEVRDAYAAEPDVNDVRVVAERDGETLYECTLLGNGLLSTVFEHGGVPQELTEHDGDVTLIVELPASRDVREFAAAVQESFPSASLVARRQRDRQLETTVGFRREFEKRLTDRNLEVVKTAYYSGFFEWPRENSGKEVAAALGVSQPTFNRHLRTAQKTLFEMLIEGE